MQWVAERLCKVVCLCIVVSVPTVLTATQSLYSMNNHEHCTESDLPPEK